MLSVAVWTQYSIGYLPSRTSALPWMSSPFQYCFSNSLRLLWLTIADKPNTSMHKVTNTYTHTITSPTFQIIFPWSLRGGKRHSSLAFVACLPCHCSNYWIDPVDSPKPQLSLTPYFSLSLSLFLSPFPPLEPSYSKDPLQSGRIEVHLHLDTSEQGPTSFLRNELSEKSLWRKE